MAQGGGYSVQAFLEAADSGSDGNSLDGESQDTVGFDANGGSRALEISSAHAQIAALQSQNAKLQRDNDEAETQAAAAKLKCKKFEKRVSALRKENEDFSVREQRLKQEVGELNKKLKAARNQKGEPTAMASNQAKRLQDQVDRLQKQVIKFENEQKKNAAKTEHISAAATREPFGDMENRQPTKTSSTWIFFRDTQGRLERVAV